ncbi:hypothetical protein GCM10023178_02640 [Actinomadura luteofluorescens]
MAAVAACQATADGTDPLAAVTTSRPETTDGWAWLPARTRDRAPRGRADLAQAHTRAEGLRRRHKRKTPSERVDVLDVGARIIVFADAVAGDRRDGRSRSRSRGS